MAGSTTPYSLRATGYRQGGPGFEKTSSYDVVCRVRASTTPFSARGQCARRPDSQQLPAACRPSSPPTHKPPEPPLPPTPPPVLRSSQRASRSTGAEHPQRGSISLKGEMVVYGLVSLPAGALAHPEPLPFTIPSLGSSREVSQPAHPLHGGSFTERANLFENTP